MFDIERQRRMRQIETDIAKKSLDRFSNE